MARDSLGNFEHQVLLTVLRLGGEGYSVTVVEELEERTRREVAQAAVFIVLRRLEKKGLLTSRFEDPGAGGSGRTRCYFKLTALAMRQLKDARRQLKWLWDGVETVLDKA